VQIVAKANKGQYLYFLSIFIQQGYIFSILQKNLEKYDFLGKYIPLSYSFALLTLLVEKELTNQTN